MPRRKPRFNAKSAQRAYEQIQYDQSARRRETDRKLRAIQNEVYIRNLPEATLKRIRSELKKDMNKKHIGRRLGIPHNIIMYIWEHRND